jgi:hypothetical protein
MFHPFQAHAQAMQQQQQQAEMKSLVKGKLDEEMEKVSILPRKVPSWVEVTSSGLTHACADSVFTSWLCPRMLTTFARHRLSTASSGNASAALNVSSKGRGMIASALSLKSSLKQVVMTRKLQQEAASVAVPDRDGFFMGRNFGSIETFRGDESSNHMSYLVISVHDLHQVQTALESDNFIIQENTREAFTSSVVLQQRVISEQVVNEVSSEGISHPYDFPDFPYVKDYFPGTIMEAVTAVFCVKTFVLFGIVGCMYFQWQCFCLMRGQLKLYTKTLHAKKEP